MAPSGSAFPFDFLALRGHEGLSSNIKSAMVMGSLRRDAGDAACSPALLESSGAFLCLVARASRERKECARARARARGKNTNAQTHKSESKCKLQCKKIVLAPSCS